MKAQDFMDEKLREISDLVSQAKGNQNLNELNEYLRQIIMGPYGDTKYDFTELIELREKFKTWKRGKRGCKREKIHSA